jgi:hypothetical protein
MGGPEMAPKPPAFGAARPGEAVPLLYPALRVAAGL